MLMTLDPPTTLRARPAPITDEEDLVRWLSTAQPGEQFIYHRGFLAIDTSAIATNLPPAQRQMLQRVANRVANLCARGLVQTVQRRHGDGDCTYIVIAGKRFNAARRRLHQAMPGLLSWSAAR
jgi:hypothetical protein